MTLTYVSPSDTQRLKHGATQVKVIILENDNPGGTFQFSSDMQDSYQVKVSLFIIISCQLISGVLFVYT